MATSAVTGLRWAELTTYIEGDKNIPRLQIDERAQLPDLNSLYIYGSTNYAKVPLLDAGITLATVIELVLVPVFYAVFVLDLKLVKWNGK